MNDCKDCRYYRSTAGSILNGSFGLCVAPKTRGSLWSDCYTHRIFDACEETDCGSEGRFFEPISLGRSHGIDWERARKTAKTLAMLRRFDDQEEAAALTTDYCATRAAE